MSISQEIIEFLHRKENLATMSSAYLKAISMDGAVTFIYFDPIVSLEQMSRALPSYAARDFFGKSLTVAALAGAFKYGFSPRAKLKAQEFNTTEVDESSLYTYMYLGVMPFKIIGAANHLAYQIPLVYNIPIENINLFVFAVESVDAILQKFTINADTSLIIEGLNSKNYTKIIEGAASGINIDSAVVMEASKTGIVSVLSFDGLYLTAQKYLDVLFKPELFKKLAYQEMFYDSLKLSVAWVAIEAISQIDPFLEEFGSDITYNDFQFSGFALEQQCEL